MIVDQNVSKITSGTATVACHNKLNQITEIAKYEQNDLIIIDSRSSESSDESDIEVINQYKLEDVRPIIGKYGKYCTI